MRAELQSTTGGGVTLDLPYSDLIHLRLGYGANPYLGGDADGRADWRAILKNLQTLHVIQEAIPKSLEASLSLHGVLTMNTVAEADKREISRKEFEKHLFNSERRVDNVGNNRGQNRRSRRRLAYNDRLLLLRVVKRIRASGDATASRRRYTSRPLALAVR